MMQIKIRNTSHHPLPKYETAQSAGMDLRAYLPDGPVTLRPMERGLVKTGLFMELPAGYEAQVRPRSGLALKKGITVLNSPGTIDSVSPRWLSPDMSRQKSFRWRSCRTLSAVQAASATRERVED